MNTQTAVVIGLGAIGMGYDIARAVDDTSVVVTHAQALAVHPAFDLVVGIDPDAEKRAAFTEKFGKPAFASLTDFHKQGRADFYALAVPTDQQATLAAEILDQKPKTLLCEKPFTASKAQAQKLVQQAEKNGTKLYVNFIRRYEPGVNALKKLITDGKLGSFRKGQLSYTKGLWNNASHMINLAQYLLGELSADAVLASGLIAKDPEPDFMLNAPGGPLYGFATPAQDYTLLEMTLNFEKGRILYNNGGREILFQTVKPDPNFTNYKILSDAETIPNDLMRYQWHVLDAIAKNAAPDNALATLDILEQIIELRNKMEKAA